MLRKRKFRLFQTSIYGCDLVEHAEFDALLSVGIAARAIRHALTLSGDGISVALSDK